MLCFVLPFMLTVLIRRSSTVGAASITKTVVVDQFGGGDFKSIQAAVASIPDGNQQWTQIYVKKGTYWEKVSVPTTKTFIVLQGEGSKNTKIVWGDPANAMYSGTFQVYANDFVARDIAFVNSFEGKGKQIAAVAALVGGDRNSFHRCSFIGFQDTLCDYLGRHLFKDCWIEGTVDFIFGFGQSLYQDVGVCTVQDCVLNSVGAGSITAHAKVHPSDSSGFVFKYCTIRASEATYLGRAWNQYSTVVFYKTYMPAQIIPQGWDAWHTTPNEYLTTFAEDHCMGPGSDTLQRVSWMKHLNATQSSDFLSINFIGPDRWVAQQP